LCSKTDVSSSKRLTLVEVEPGLITKILNFFMAVNYTTIPAMRTDTCRLVVAANRKWA